MMKNHGKTPPRSPRVPDAYGKPSVNTTAYLKRAEEALAEMDLSELSNAERITYAQAAASIATAGCLQRLDETFPDVHTAAQSVLGFGFSPDRICEKIPGAHGPGVSSYLGAPS